MTENHHQEGFRFNASSSAIGADGIAAIEKAIFLNNPVGAIVGYYDENLTILSASDYILHNLHYTPQTFAKQTGGSLRPLFFNAPFLDAERFRSISQNGEGQMITAEGVPVSVLLRKEDSRDAQGTPIWILAVHVDWERENLRLVNEALKSAPWHMSCNDDGSIASVKWSHELRRMLGYRDVLDLPNTLDSWKDLLHPEDHDAVLERLDATLADKTNKTKFDAKYRLRASDDSYQWFRTIAEVSRRPDGRPYRIAGSFINIDAELAAQKTHSDLIERNAAMRHLINSVTRIVDHFAICDLAGNHYSYVTMSLDSSYPATGTYSDLVECVTSKFKTLAPLATLEDLLAADNLASALQEPDDSLKFEYCSLDEDVYRVASFIPLAFEDGKLTRVLWTSNDITQIKLDEIAAHKALKDAYFAADRASRAKTEFLSNMSHDIRTPMNAIVGMTAIAGANIDNSERVLECLGKITSSSRHLLALINEVLDMARIESGKISLSEEEFNIAELVDNLIAMSQPSIEKHHHDLVIHINGIEHEDVIGDSLRIQQVFVNLMSNAIKYTPDGGNIVLTIEEKHNKTSDLGCYVFTIEDDGIGMTPEFQKVMFEPFTRADDHRTTKVQGTGLGMAVTKNIVEMMNGSISVTSAPNQGTKISVTIYLKRQDKGIEAIEQLQDLPVLVVDDDVSCCESTAEVLAEIGITSEWATSGQEAIALTLARHEDNDDFFAILMDWQMPGMDGIETTRQIRKHIGREVTIIVLTALDYHEIEEEARAAGVDAFIEKPLFRSKLAAVLEGIATGKPRKRANRQLERLSNACYAGKRVLLAEDNEINRDIAVEILQMTGMDIDTAENGKEACEYVSTAPEGYYDLILMDIQMPIMNGYEACAAIRSLDGARSKVPIIAMTANAFAEDVQLAKSTGMNEHIAKPLDFEKLADVLETYLGKQGCSTAQH